MTKHDQASLRKYFRSISAVACNYRIGFVFRELINYILRWLYCRIIIVYGCGAGDFKPGVINGLPLRIAAGVVNIGDAIAILERSVADRCYTNRDNYASKARATRERIRADDCYATRYSYAFEARAILKRSVIY